MNKRYIIIGTGIAGLSAAEAIREADRNGQIAMFTAEDDLPYSRPMLTKTPFCSFDPKQWTIHDTEWFSEKNIDLHIGEPVTFVDPHLKTVYTSSGSHPYDKLVLATGAENFVPPFKGADSPFIFTIRRTEDIFRIKRYCRSSAKAVVIGGGVIGLEAAAELWRYGTAVTVLEAAPYLMMRQIDRELSDLICQKLKKDMDIYTDVSIESVEQLSSDTAQVLLKDGRAFPCDLVIVACGVRASLSIVPDTVNAPRAIEIDDNCRTSDKDIFAAGDCAQYKGVNYALWSQALAQGRTAGLNAAGEEKSLRSFDTSLVINSPLLSLFALGDMGKDRDREYDIKYISASENAAAFYVNPSFGERFEKLVYHNGRLVGAAIIGNLSHMESLKEEILGKEAQR